MSLFSFLNKKNEPSSNVVPKNKVSVLMQDGTIEKYDEKFIITDGENCVVCNSKFYHTSLDCENLKFEMKSGEQLKAMFIKDAKKENFTYCANCSRENYLYKHDRLNELE